MDGAHRDASRLPDDGHPNITRPPESVDGELSYESTVTAPTEWVPYVYTATEIGAVVTRRMLSVASIVCGTLGLLLAIFGVWGTALSVGAVVLALVARTTERLARTLWIFGFVTGLAGLVIVAGWFVYITQVLPTLG